MIKKTDRCDKGDEEGRGLCHTYIFDEGGGLVEVPIFRFVGYLRETECQGYTTHNGFWGAYAG